MALIDEDGNVVQDPSTAWRVADMLRDRGSLQDLRDPEIVATRMQQYAEMCSTNERPMSLHDMVGHIGYASLPHMLRLAVESGGDLAWVVARGLNMIGAEYEELLLKGHKQIIKLMEKLPQIDPEAPLGPQMSVPLSPKVEMEVNVNRDSQAQQEGSLLDGPNAYMRIVRHRVLSDAEKEVRDGGGQIVENEDGTRTVDFGGDS